MVFVIDNYDSFTYNLVQYLGQLGEEVVVRRNDETTVAEVLSSQPDGILLSPGPCSPDKSGICLDILDLALADSLNRVPVFGVCLGHQAIGLQAGGTVRKAKKVMHGKSSLVEHTGQGVFAGLPQPVSMVRYHSLVVDNSAPLPGFDVTAVSTDDGEIMGLKHQTLPIEGVQFHPESIGSQDGMNIVRNFVGSTKIRA